MAAATFGPFRLELRTGELCRSGVAVKLQPQPAKLLVLLVEHAGELVTREDIRRLVWGTETFVDFDQSVNFCVRQIRTALHDNADAPCYIETLPRRGYRFIAPVQRMDEPSEARAEVGGVATRPRWRAHGAALAASALVLATAYGMFQHTATTAPPPNSKAYRDVQLGQYFLGKVSRADALKALEFFEAAVREDPEYAPAFAGLAHAYNLLGTNFVAGRRPDDVRLLARRAATRAIQLDPTIAEAHAALGYAALHELDWAEADRALRRAIELNPRYARAHEIYASYLVAQRRFDAAIDEARLAVELEPASLDARHTYASMLYYKRRYDDAAQELRTILQMNRTYAAARRRLGQVLLMAGRYDEAIDTLSPAVTETERAPAVLCLMAMAYGRRGQRAEAEQILAELERRSATQRVPAGTLTMSYLAIGDHHRAIDRLERVYADRDGFLIYVDVDPLMDPLRNDPRFHDLCRRVMLGTPLPVKATATAGGR